jgi:hypothetical protein
MQKPTAICNGCGKYINFNFKKVQLLRILKDFLFMHSEFPVSLIKKSCNETNVFGAANRVAVYIAQADSQQPIIFSYLL